MNAPQAPQPPQAPTFPFDIPSVSQKNPGIPAPILGLLDLNRTVQSGQPLDYAQVKNAKASAEALKGIHDTGNHPLLTERMVISAHARATTLDSTYAAVEYSPQNIAQTLQQINNHLQGINRRIRDIDERMEGMEGGMEEGLAELNALVKTMDQTLQVGQAHTANLRIINRNARLQTPNVLEPLQKTVSGSGRDLITPFLAALDQVDRRAMLNGPAHPDVEEAEIGEVPPDFDPYVASYSLYNVLEMMIFYNESFGIVAQDALKVQVSKFGRFFVEF